MFITKYEYFYSTCRFQKTVCHLCSIDLRSYYGHYYPDSAIFNYLSKYLST